MFRIKVKDNKTYIYTMDTDSQFPRFVLSYWLTKSPAYPELDELPVYELGNAKYVKCFGKEIPVNPVGDYPEFTEFIPVKKPKGKYIWKFGEWIKQY